MQVLVNIHAVAWVDAAKITQLDYLNNLRQEVSVFDLEVCDCDPIYEVNLPEDIELLETVAKNIDEHGEAFARYWDLYSIVTGFQERYVGCYDNTREWLEEVAKDDYGMDEDIHFNFIDWDKFETACYHNYAVVESATGNGIFVFRHSTN